MSKINPFQTAVDMFRQVADQMGISLNTVNSHKKVILELCRNVWTKESTVRYHHLREWFGPYFDL